MDKVEIRINNLKMYFFPILKHSDLNREMGLVRMTCTSWIMILVYNRIFSGVRVHKGPYEQALNAVW